MKVETKKETRGFQAEVKQLLSLMIRSLYSNKEIFLRELISNASDAIDKLRFKALSNDALYDGDADLKINVNYDKEARTITISDNGIGMTREEVIDHIGTIAKSGTKQFFESLTGDQNKDAKLIGQFGVGFYSAFIIADNVTLETRAAGAPQEEGVRWISAGEGEYTIEPIQKKARGTHIVLHLREGEEDLLDGFMLRGIIHTYSDHIPHPIIMPGEKIDPETKEIKQGPDERVNKASALWARPKNEIKKEEYEEFYQHLAHDFDAPLAHVHNHVEGKQEYISLFYIPSHAPFDLWDRERRHGIKLYVRRVFIMDDAQQLMPVYLRFVRGLVDSNDLPLNISREILQQNKDIDSIRAASVKRVLGLLTDLAEKDKKAYAKFWGEYGRVLKEGIVEDTANRETLSRLCRFHSTHESSETQDVSFEDYVARMPKEQKKIYYLTAESYAAAKNSPHLEVFRAKGIEVLLFVDPIDEWVMAQLPEFDGKALQSVTKGELDLGDLADQESKAEQEKAAETNKDFIARIKEILKEEVKDVRPTVRLTKSPACLVADKGDMGANLERLLAAAGQKTEPTKPILEINLEHALLKRLSNESDDERFQSLSRIIYEQALLSEGAQLKDPADFVHRLNELLTELSA